MIDHVKLEAFEFATPGPWKAERGWFVDKDGCFIPNTYSNVELLAAAPELLAEVLRLEAQNQQLRAALEAAQWANCCRCPTCGAEQDSLNDVDELIPGKHKPDCTLWKALAKS
jgi:hypothetical protein